MRRAAPLPNSVRDSAVIFSDDMRLLLVTFDIWGGAEAGGYLGAASTCETPRTRLEQRGAPVVQPALSITEHPGSRAFPRRGNRSSLAAGPGRGEFTHAGRASVA